MKANNIFQNIPGDVPEEVFEEIIKGQNIEIERIISKGHTSPEKGWYDQVRNEWVIILKGGAKIRFAQGNQCVHLTEGSYINIPAHAKHKVEWTDPKTETIWLAIHYGSKTTQGVT